MNETKDLESRVARLEHIMTDAIVEIKDAVNEIRELVRKTDKFETRYETLSELVKDQEARLRRIEINVLKWTGAFAVVVYLIPIAVKHLGG